MISPCEENNISITSDNYVENLTYQQYWIGIDDRMLIDPPASFWYTVTPDYCGEVNLVLESYSSSLITLENN